MASSFLGCPPNALVRNLKRFDCPNSGRGVSTIRPSPDPDAYPEEPNGVDEARQSSSGRVRGLASYRFAVAFSFILLIIAGSLNYYSTTLGPFHLLYPVIAFGSIFSLVLAGVLILLIICDVTTGGIFTGMRLSRQRREARVAQTRAARRLRRRQRSEAPQDSSRQPSPEQYDSLPAWLLPLLKNRPASLSLHDEITATATTTEETETMLETAIDDLVPEGSIITIPPDKPELQPTDRETVSDQPYEVEYPTEATIEREAALDLLGALELQYKDGRLTDDFYKRKRKQLLDRLAALS